MAYTLNHRMRVSRKRYTWPRTQVDQLETIPESPRTPQVAKFTSDTSSEERTYPADDVATLSDSEQCMRYDEKVVPPEAVRAQMIWYSHQLEISYHDRERLDRRIKELEVVCRSQSKTNASLIHDIQSWQKNYDAVESELVDAAQEMEEVKAYVRSVETANANLRYALSQAREEQEHAHRRRWNHLAHRCWQRCTRLSEILVDACRLPSMRKRKKQDNNASKPAARPESTCPILHSSTSKISLPPSSTC